MSKFTLELIASNAGSYEQAQSITLDLVDHVHQRVERFRYLDDIKTVAVALDYLENPELDSWRHLQIANRTYSIAANASANAEVRKDWASSTSTALSSPYKEVLITDRLGVDQHGESRPLFWRHELGDDVAECNLEIVTFGNVQKVDSGYTVDLDSGNIYTNFKNFFDPDTGAYTLFYVTCTDSAGNSSHQLLDPQPVAKEADWEDIDLTTGKLVDDYPVYSPERNSSGYTFYMNTGSTWYYRPLEKSLIQPRLPTGRDPEDPWYLRFSAGDVSALVNGRLRRYYVPEFDQQNYSPFKPFIYSPYGRMLWVNERVLASTRKNIAVDPDRGLHLTVFISDFENTLLRVLTTDPSLGGTRYSDTNVFYEADQIRSWDNEGGFISLGTKIHPSHEISAQYYYEADDYECTLINMNPLYNKSVKDRMIVFYMVPDVDPDDRAIHYLAVDQDGIIRECSQNLGFAHPNLQLFEADGTTYNANTIIGSRYISDIETDTFVNNYSAGYENDFAYGILAEVVFLNLDRLDDMKLYDVREAGGFLRESREDSALRANPKILQSAVVYGQDGQEIPKSQVMLVKAPLSLLENYGGNLSEDKAQELMTRHLHSAVLPVIEWEYPSPDLNAWSTVVGRVDVSWSWEGTDQTYKLYKRSNPVGEWVEVYSVAGASTPVEMSYTDTNVELGDVLYYAIRVEETVNGETVLYPLTYQVAVKVKG